MAILCKVEDKVSFELQLLCKQAITSAFEQIITTTKIYLTPNMMWTDKELEEGHHDQNRNRPCLSI